MPVTVVVGAQWGDEGKGKVTDLLAQGGERAAYGDPVEMAEKWVEQGAAWIHLVDLDGAKAGRPVNNALVERIAQNVPVPVQVGGGIRQVGHIEAYLQAGVRRVILGTSAVKQPDFVEEALRSFADSIAIGLDARDGYVATEGWLQSSQLRADEVALRLQEHGAGTFIFTDNSKDGTLSGPNVQATVKLAKAIGQEVIASGGVSSLEDVRELAAKHEEGLGGVIIGKALYQNRFSLREALAVCRKTEEEN
jgi:phosphoribosylformimino-5-aminoimidazole carboxamide ribotide isomerase